MKKVTYTWKSNLLIKSSWTIHVLYFLYFVSTTEVPFVRSYLLSVICSYTLSLVSRFRSSVSSIACLPISAPLIQSETLPFYTHLWSYPSTSITVRSASLTVRVSETLCLLEPRKVLVFRLTPSVSRLLLNCTSIGYWPKPKITEVTLRSPPIPHLKDSRTIDCTQKFSSQTTLLFSESLHYSLRPSSHPSRYKLLPLSLSYLKIVTKGLRKYNTFCLSSTVVDTPWNFIFLLTVSRSEVGYPIQ